MAKKTENNPKAQSVFIEGSLDSTSQAVTSPDSLTEHSVVEESTPEATTNTLHELVKELRDANEKNVCKDVDKLIAQLQDDNRDVRYSALQHLFVLNDLRLLSIERAVAPVIACLKDNDPAVRREAAETLKKFGDERAVLPLINCLQDPDLKVCLSAISALTSLNDERAVLPLIPLSDDFKLREYAVTALGKLHDKRAIPHLQKLLDTDDIRFVRTVAFALSVIARQSFLHDKRAITNLQKLLNTDDIRFVRTVGFALSLIATPKETISTPDDSTADENQDEIEDTGTQIATIPLLETRSSVAAIEHDIGLLKTLDIEAVRAKMRQAFDESPKTQEQIGVDMGMQKHAARTIISRLLSPNSGRDPQLSTILAFAEAVGCSPTFFFESD